jgi:ABC-type multidrug transport system, ATPase component
MLSSGSIVVSVRGVSKCFRDFSAISDVSFEVNSGSIVGVLGRNGAGKSTLVSMLSGLSRPTSGTVRVLGGDPQQPRVRQRLGVVPQDVSLPGNLTGNEIAEFVSAHYLNANYADTSVNVNSSLEVFRTWNLEEFSHKKIKHLSGGQKRRIAVGLAFVGNPLVAILDEPTTGLDPEARRAMWNQIQSAAEEGVTVVITSHYLDEIEYLSSRILLLDGGTLIEDRPAEEFLAMQKSATVTFASSSSTAEVLKLAGTTMDVRSANGCYSVRTTDSDRFIERLVRSSLQFTDLRVRGWSLEDIFLEKLEKSHEN